jgi:hypothetical protein
MQKPSFITIDNIGRAATNIVWAIWQLMCFFETFVLNSTLGILMNFSASNPPHHQTENRWLWRYCSSDRSRQIYIFIYHADWLFDHRSTN